MTVMTYSMARRGSHRDRNTRLHQRTRAAALLTAYLDAVADALAGYGWRVEHRAVTTTRDLQAELTLRSGDPILVEPDAAGHPVRVRWEEDTGWCVSRHLLGAHAPALHHYLPTALVPAPTQVAHFIDDVLAPTRDPYDPGFTWMGVPYPTRFRHRGQPLAPVLDAIERAIATADDASEHPDLKT